MRFCFLARENLKLRKATQYAKRVEEIIGEVEGERLRRETDDDASDFPYS